MEDGKTTGVAKLINILNFCTQIHSRHCFHVLQHDLTELDLQF